MANLAVSICDSDLGARGAGSRSRRPGRAAGPGTVTDQMHAFRLVYARRIAATPVAARSPPEVATVEFKIAANKYLTRPGYVFWLLVVLRQGGEHVHHVDGRVAHLSTRGTWSAPCG